ncbi:MAG: NAD-dependent epimerase/dehydratase family protein [Sphingomonadaceae bacterium]
MRYLVTGVAGFIGAAVARALLDRGDAVLGIDSLNAYYDPALKRARLATLDAPGFAFRQLDFADDAAFDAAMADEAFDRIIHLGAQPGVRYSLENPRAYVRANIAGHLNLLELARTRRTAHMVYASSSSVYGDARALPLSVDARVDHPISLYAASKKADELMSETYAHLHRLPLTGLRFFTVYGPWGRPDMAPWIFTAKILAGEPIPVFNEGKLRRDFTYIDDIVAGVVAAVDRPAADDGMIKPGGSAAPHAIYNLGNNRSEALMDFIAAIEAACGRQAICDFKPMQPGDVHETFADIAESTRDLDYAPATAIEVGIPKFVDWYRRYIDA